MADYSYYEDYPKASEQHLLDWAVGKKGIPFIAEELGSLQVPSQGSLGEVKAAQNPQDKYKAAYKYAFARDFAHRYRTGSAFLLKAGFAGTSLPANVRVAADKDLNHYAKKCCHKF